MGYIGLPTASTLATHGLEVVGVDVNQRVLDVLRNGEIHIHEPGLRTLVKAAFQSGNLRISDVPETSDAFIIAVPTPITSEKHADMSHVVSAAESIVPFIREGNLVMLESTSPPRTTVDLVAPILEQSGLRPGSDFFLAYTPERVLPGQILRELIDNARIIGGINPQSAEAGRELYATFVRGDISLTGATTAEMVKLMENTYRDINIAAANEFSRLAERFNVNVWEAIQLANLHPRVNILKPGPGVGGHCVSIDPWFLVEAAPDLSLLIHQARLVNDGQPAFTVSVVDKALGGLSGRRIAALGLAYKADVDDLRESPAMEVAGLLAKGGAEVITYEPFAPTTSASDCKPAESLKQVLEGADAILLLVDHTEFKQMDPNQAAGIMRGRVAIDARGVWERDTWEQAGFKLFVLGAGEWDV
ncbi:MAG: nucleotide sugar dehydrogenase [Anaerolineales bacterium]|nr:nucleotide sugar dehydrogenase [Anaerolineales bacterium]